MTITIEISPEVGVGLSRQAASNGTLLAVSAAAFLQDFAHLSASALSPEPGKSLREVFEFVPGLGTINHEVRPNRPKHDGERSDVLAAVPHAGSAPERFKRIEQFRDPATSRSKSASTPRT
jgi:hypothetical protein